MKKLILSILLLVSIATQAAVYTTNLTAGGTFFLLSGRASVYNVELTSDKTVLVEFFDASSLADPYFGTNYVTSEYISKAAYVSNIVNSYVGQNGFTNWYTNSGIYTLSVTNAAATNALPKIFAGAVSANTYAVLNTDALFVNGIVARASTNVSIIITYRSGQ